MFAALSLAFKQFSDPRVRRAVWLSLASTLALLAIVVAILWWGIAQVSLVTTGWIDTIIDLAAGLGVLVLAWLLFPAAAVAVVGLFLDDVAGAVEARHYPQLPPAREQPIVEAVWSGLRFALIAIALNLLVLPIYLIPPLIPVVFYGLNGYLLGREYFELVALRRCDARQVREMRRAHGRRVFLAGVAIALLLTVPLLNLVSPVIATAFMVHLFEVWRRPVTRQ